MERKKGKRLVETSHEEIEAKRLKMNTERTITQNEATSTLLRYNKRFMFC
jgi:hypothetical protein